MSIREALNGYRAAHKLTSPNTTNGLRDLVLTKFSSLMEFSRAAGYVNSGSVSSVLRNEYSIQPTTAERWAKVLGVTAEEVIAAKRPVAKHSVAKPKRKSPGAVVVHPVLSPALTPHRKEATSRPEKFSLTVNANGTAAVKLDMPDLPLDVALKLVAVLELPGLLNRPLRIAHEEKENIDGTQ